MNTTSTQTNESILESYQRDGFLIAHELLTASECESLKQEALRVLKETGRPFKSIFVGVAAASPIYYRLASDPRVIEILEKIMPDGIAFMSDKFVLKSGSKQFASPWHIDAAYWRNTRPKVSVWIPLDDSSEANGTLKVLPGSHLKEWKHKKAEVTATNSEFGEQVSEQQWKSEAELICNVKKGGAIFFSDKLLHASCTNSAGLDRYVIISTYHAPAEDEEIDKLFPARHVIVSGANA